MHFCPNCGKELNDGMQFCPGCGTSINTVPESGQAPENETIKNSAASLPYTTVQYTPGYEQAVEQPKKKVNKLIPVLIVISLVVIGAAVGTVKYFSGEAYKYKKAVEALNSGDYDKAFNMFYSLGDYEDSESFLPFHGKYVSVSVGDERYLKFTDGKYEEMIPGRDDDSYYYGTYITDGFESAVLTDDDDGNVETYKIYKNYIYETENEDFIFDETVDISSGLFNGTISEVMTIDLSSITVDIKWKYSFEEDGTYVYTSERFTDGKELDSPSTETGTYDINGDCISLTPNDDGDEKTFLVIDEYVYRTVYVRNY